MKEVFEKIKNDESLSDDELLSLLKIENNSKDYDSLLALSYEKATLAFNHQGYIFVQIGLNNEACYGGCHFCTLAKQNHIFDSQHEYHLSLEELKTVICKINFSFVNALFLMTTADFDQKEFLSYVRMVKNLIPAHVKLTVNTGDFDLDYAYQLKHAGVDAAYHIVRLKEGQDTGISPERRIQTLNAIKESGIELFYCIEPIGKEHTYQEIATEIKRAKQLNVNVMAVMARVNIKGTKFEKIEMISDEELAKIAAVTYLYVRPQTSMNVHEINEYVMQTGINQLYVEMAFNPRDCRCFTENSRGRSLTYVKELLNKHGYQVSIGGDYDE